MSPDQALGSDLLRRELEEIGRKRRSLEVSSLFAYRHLLECPLVAARADSKATGLQLAKHARQAIIEAIERIGDSTDKRIAEAILCTNDDFSGKTVEARKALLASDGISAEMYKKRRSAVLDFVTSFLLQDNNVEPDDGDGSEPGPREILPGVNNLPEHLHRRLWPPTHSLSSEAGRAFEPLILHFSDLYYATLCYIFITNLNANPHILTQPRIKSPQWQYVSGSTHALLFAFRLFRLISFKSGPPCCDVNSSGMLWAAANMPPSDYRELCFMVSTLPMTPLGSYTELQEIVEGLAWGSTVKGKPLDYREVNRINKAVAEYFGIVAQPINGIPNWSAVQITPLARISVLAAKSVAILHLLGVSVTNHILTSKREEHLAKIRELYSIFETTDQIIGGEPVRVIPTDDFSATVVAYASDFCDAANDIFAISPAMWVNYSSDEQDFVKWASKYPPIKPAT